MRTLIAVVLFAVAAEGQQVAVRVVPETLAVDPQTNTASALIIIDNPGAQDADLLLVADDFVAEGQRVGAGSKTVFGLNDETPSKTPLEVKVPAKKRVRVRMDVSKLGHAGLATAHLLNHATPLARLTAVKAQLPFNVGPLGRSGEAPVVIRFEGGAGPMLHLRNDDPHDYFVRWRLTTGGLPPKQIDGPERISAQSTASFQISDAGWRPESRDLVALLKNRESAGTLHLEATSADGKQVWKRRDIPVTIQRSRWSATGQAWRTFAVLAVLVALGGIMSIFVTHGVPNWQRYIAVRDQIMATTPKIRAISTAVDSNLRTAVRVERTRLLQRLRSRSRISPDFAALASDCEAAARRLDREIVLLDRIDAKMRQIERKWPTAGVHGPTLLQQGCALLAEAQMVLDRPDVDDQVVNAADGYVQRAETTIDNASTIAESSKAELKRRLESLRDDAQLMASADAKEIIEQLPGLAAALEWKPDADLSDANFARIDVASAKLDYVRRFVELCQKAKQSVAKTKCTEDFVTALRRGGFSDFREAEALTAQMREQMFTDTVAGEIRSGRYGIEVEPQAPKVNQVVSFAVVFHDREVNTSAARHSMTCTWKFHHPPAPVEMSWPQRVVRRLAAVLPKVLRPQMPAVMWQTWTEKGLAVSHYFPVAGTFDVAVEFRDEDGNELKSATPISQEVSVEADRLKVFGEHTKIEYSKLAVVLAITVAGLLVGARDELAKLDLVPGLIAVFMLGFTADQIKNILAPHPTK